MARTTAAAWKSLLRRSGFRRGGTSTLIVHLILFAAFGVLVPWMRGLDFFDPIVVFSYTAIAFLFAASAVTQLMSEDRRRVWPAVVASALHGWSVLLLVQILGIATVNYIYRAPRILHPNWKLLAASALFALAGALFIASLGAMLSVVFSPAVARNAVRFGFLLMLLAFVFAPGRLPVDLQAAIDRQLTTEGLTQAGLILAAASTVLAVGLLFALRPRPQAD